MKPLRIIDQHPRRLIGMSVRMSNRDNKTAQVWKAFMPRRKELSSTISSDYFSVQVYDGTVDFSPETVFSKWASMEVGPSVDIPDGMEELILPAGTYAVFGHTGPAANFPVTLGNIFTWLEESNYKLDHRPQFEVLPQDYPGPASEDAEEEIWMPVSRRV